MPNRFAIRFLSTTPLLPASQEPFWFVSWVASRESWVKLRLVATTTTPNKKNKNISEDNATMEATDLKKTIMEQDWEETSRILKHYPHLAEEQIAKDEFTILWRQAPLEIILTLLEAWPEAHIMESRGSANLVKAKSIQREWDFLDKVCQEFPQVTEMKYSHVTTAAMYGASLQFLNKHWKDTGTFIYYMHNKYWEEASRILEDYPHLAKDRLSEEDFNILWSDGPWHIIRTLLQAWPEAYKHTSRRHGSLVKAKLYKHEWDLLDKIFQEFPHVLETKYVTDAAVNGASIEFLNRYWKETGSLLYSVHNKDWKNFGVVLKDYPHLAKERLSRAEFDILWLGAPLEVIQTLLKVWPKAYEMKGSGRGNLVQTNLDAKQWDFLKSIIQSSSQKIVTTGNVYAAIIRKGVPIDVFELMLGQQPNAPIEKPGIIFRSIGNDKLEYFRAVVNQCPAATEVKEERLQLTPLLLMFQKKELMNTDWIGPILKANPSAAKQKDFDGKTALHLAYQHGASFELIDMVLQAHPEAEKERDNLGRFPKELANQSEQTVFTAANETLILRDKLNIEKNNSYPENAVVVCRCDMLVHDPQAAEGTDVYRSHSKQVLARDRIFETLLDEFSKMVGVDDKDIIQKAAAVQALAAPYLSNQDGTIINFGLCDNPAYWYQQEVLKLVMRVHHEGQSKFGPYPSILKDAFACMWHLNNGNNSIRSPKPSEEHFNAYNDLARWLTEGFDKSSYSLQGPVLKPLQSLFNKLFIRRGQTSVSVIGDMVRGTLLIDDMGALQEIIKKIKNAFPNITMKQFRQPDSTNGLAGFLNHVHDNLKFLPTGSDVVLPYRFKANSSQKKKEEPSWYNFNFFLQVPEYHRVGFSEMFVACELQIGLTEEVNKHRQTHVAYERDRILLNQPLLKNYDSMTKEEGNADRLSQLVNCTEDDNKLIEKVLFGKIASEVLIPYTTTGNDNENNILLFENGPFSLSNDEVEAGSFVKPERLCLNNRSLNWFALDCPKRDRYGTIRAAFNVAGPYELDKTKRYFLESFLSIGMDGGWAGTIGLYAHVGPYLIQIACGCVPVNESEDIVFVKSGQNFSYLEQMCPVPVGTTSLEVIVYGEIGEFKYDKMKLSLKVFDVLVS